MTLRALIISALFGSVLFTPTGYCSSPCSFMTDCMDGQGVLPRTEPYRQPKLYAKCHFDNRGPDRTMIIYVFQESGWLEVLAALGG